MLTKRSFLLILSVLLIAAVSCINNNPVASEEIEKTVIVYYFHTTFRCYSCYTIEKYTKEAIEEFFGDELSSGKLIFRPLNVEKKENRRFVKDYQLYTKSVVVSLVKNGEEVKFNNLEKVWHYLRNKEQFFNYIKDEVNNYLKETE